MLLQETSLSLSGITDFVIFIIAYDFLIDYPLRSFFPENILFIHHVYILTNDMIIRILLSLYNLNELLWFLDFTLFFYKTHTEWSVCEKVQWHSLIHEHTLDCFIRCIDLFHNGHNYSVLIPRSWAQSFEVYHSSTRLISELKYRSKDQKLHKWIMFSEPKPCWNVVGFFCSKWIPRHYVRCNSLSWFSNKILNSSFVPSHDIFKYCAHWRLMMTQIDR